MTVDSLPGQEPPTIAETKPAPGKKRLIPKDIRLRMLRVWLRFIRIKIAKAILLPELSFDQSQELRQSVREDGALTSGYVLMCALSAGIATLGLLQSSTAVVIGAMLISPLMSPIAALGFGFASFDGKRIREAVRVVAVGAGIGILTGILLTWLSPIRNATPEILARTQPTLLDLAVALFSGIAGGYATVIRKGGTAIGVAIATALMPPLAVLGYGIGVFQIRFALGAALLFLTNLAAITFSFAVIARLSGAARPLFRVEWTPRYTAILVAAFLVLATPLTMTLLRITAEANMRSEASSAILEACGKGADIAQLDVSWPLFGEPSVEALVVSPKYSPTAEQDAEKQLAERLGDEVDISLQQVLAADWQSQARVMLDAAMERTKAGIAADVPPFDNIRADIGLPTRAIWTNTAERVVYVEPVPAPGWTLADYAQVEKVATKANEKWSVRIIPPPQAIINVVLPAPAPSTADEKPKVRITKTPDDAIATGLAVWALQRWGMASVDVTAPDGAAAQNLTTDLKKAGIKIGRIDRPVAETANQIQNFARIRVFAQSPSQRAAAAKAKAEAEAKEAAGREAQGT